MNRNVMISLSLFESIFGLLDALDAERYGYNFECEYEIVMKSLNTKMHKLELRNAYSRIVPDTDEDARVRARFQFLWRKRQLRKVRAKVPDNTLL